VVRRSEQGWQVGDEQAADLTSAMVLADLLAADLGLPAPPPAGLARSSRSEPVSKEEEGQAARLAVTVAQLEHALAARGTGQEAGPGAQARPLPPARPHRQLTPAPDPDDLGCSRSPGRGVCRDELSTCCG
jgi:hypothetical protein